MRDRKAQVILIGFLEEQLSRAERLATERGIDPSKDLHCSLLRECLLQIHKELDGDEA